eukprot:TRINITY_DN190_c0_g1_i1.p1 TRINITY_DN190_c0_g1~~TRINITY_DN190_c0_g1_i1.p1  ORF type:complete len:1013 (-),score=292.50 TRINITY_DN190_c0_g1_i1:62-3100(-)
MVCAMTSIDEPAASDVGLPPAQPSSLVEAANQDSGDANSIPPAHVSNIENSEEPHSNGTSANKGLKRSRGDTTAKAVPDTADPPLGKRVRKPNTLLAGYEQDQKTHEKNNKSNSSNSPAPASSLKDSLQSSSEVQPTGEGESTQPPLAASTDAAAQAVPPASATEPPKTAKEIIMTPAQAQERNKRMPKGYAYVPEVVPTEPPPPESLPKKRERKQVNYVDFQQLKGRLSRSADGESPVSPQALTASGSALPAISPSPSPSTSTKRVKTIKEETLAPIVQNTESKSSKNNAKKVAQQRKKELQAKLKQLDAQLKELTKREEMEKQQLLSDSGSVEMGSPPPAAPKKRRNSKTNIPTEAGVTPTETPTKKTKTTTPKPPKESKPKAPSPSPPPESGRPHRSTRRRTSRETLSPISTTTTLSPQLKHCQRILTQVMAHNLAWPFNQPVDPVALNIPDYFDVIKHPMDLGTIKERLDDGHYHSISEFASDVRLVWKNAMTYNPPGSDVYIMADIVAKAFESKYAKLEERQQKEIKEKKEKEREREGEKKKEKKDRQEKKLSTPLTSEDMTAQIAAMVREQVKNIIGKERPPVRRPPSKPKRVDDNRPMSKEEKRALSLAINDLASEHLGMVVQIIHERMPELAKNAENGEIEIDIDALDTPTLRHLEKYVKECSTPSAPVVKKSRSRKSSIAPVQNELQQAAEETETGTAKRIEEVQRRLQEIQSQQRRGGSSRPTKKADQEEDVVIDDDVPRSYPPVVIEKDKPSESDSSSDSDSDSSSDSDSDSSDSDSDSSDSSDTESESEKKSKHKVTGLTESKNAHTPAVNKPPTVFSPPPKSTPTPLVQDVKIKDSPIGSPPIQSLRSPPPAAPAILPVTPVVPVSTVAPAAPIVTKEVVLQNVEAWANLDEDEDDNGKTVSNQNSLWSEFKNKDELLKQKEREREEQEERLKREREALEEERRKEEERKKREAEEALAEQKRKEEEAEALARKEREQRRLQAKLEREMKASKVIESFQ